MATRTPRTVPVLAAAWLLVCALASCAASDPPPPPPPVSATRPLPDLFNGVTLDDVTELPELVASLGALPQRPTERIVFDADTEPSAYRAAVAALHPISYLMGLPMDSFEVADASLTEYHDRTAALLAEFGGQIDVWEVGNEINGEWLGPAPEVTEKVTDAYRQVVAAGGRTALTLYYNPGCAEDPEHQMLPWTKENVPQEIRDGLDYVLVSYYEDACNDYRPPLEEWNAVFTELADLFPHARVGFGENGTDEHASLDAKLEQLTHYYTLPVTAPRYLGGHFWWYYAEDMLPYPPANQLWTALSEALTPPPA
ncbi:hypothetical protein F4556_001954 [Kitasatospora gansuensis]|uniref:Transmembrane protein n=1 Tax=Kitasatospora gansuensis TaxID=258050 RepID=A0A7W7S9M2_9ACTN|nr:hypothetical protein [Kitasatospora gansuensis]MBB4946419.1 hypothetical protein [Kitasatospora gansuensis]